MIWMDRRAEAEVKQLDEMLGEGTIYRVTGNRPDAFYVAPKLLWFKKHEPQLLEQTFKFVQVNGYINFRLTAEFSLDSAHASLLQLRDTSSGEWYQPIFDVCGIEPGQFPEEKSSQCICGVVTPSAAEATGLRPGTPVMVGTVDSAAAALEVGAAEPGVAAEMTGTSTVLIMPNREGLTEPASSPCGTPSPEFTCFWEPWSLPVPACGGFAMNWERWKFGGVPSRTWILLISSPGKRLRFRWGAVA